MKPKDLKAAFTWEQRRPLIDDRIFHVPTYYDNYAAFPFPGWASLPLFGNENPVCIEYCAGNGGWILERAKRAPELNWVAVEKRYDRVRKIWSKIKNEKLNNLLAVCGEAWLFTHHYVPSHSVEEVFINFPDPWPKQKHEKHRLMKPGFLDELSRILKEGRRVTFVSDDADYVASTEALFLAHPPFVSAQHVRDLPEYGTSWFESLWRKKGREIHYLQFYTT